MLSDTQVLWISIFCFLIIGLERKLSRTESPFHWLLGMETKEFAQNIYPGSVGISWFVTATKRGDTLIPYIVSPGQQCWASAMVTGNIQSNAILLRAD